MIQSAINIISLQDMKCLLFLLALLLVASPKLLYLAELFRHGARYPVSDIYDGKDTKPFHGQLTGVGMRQQYLLGSYLKRDYVDSGFLNGTLDPSQVQVFTDTSQRCYESASAHTAGLFGQGQGAVLPHVDAKYLQPPFGSEPQLQADEEGQFALTGGYQPVPILPGPTYFEECKNQPLLIAERFQAIATKTAQLQAQQALFTEKIRVMFNLSVQLSNIAGLVELYDTVVCDLNLGRAMPANFTDKDFSELRYVQNYLFILLYAEKLAHVISTPIAAAVIDKMEKAIASKLDNKKLSIYSGHDTNVAPMLSFMNLSSADCVRRKYRNETVVGNCAEPVPFASNVIFELHQNDAAPSSHYVRVKYNGAYYQLCDKRQTQCDFNEFRSRVRAHLVDYKKQCGNK